MQSNNKNELNTLLNSLGWELGVDLPQWGYSFEYIKTIYNHIEELCLTMEILYEK